MTDRTWYLIVVAVFGGILAAVVFGFAATVNAQETPIIDVPITTRFVGDPGSLHVVATVPADPGLDCNVTLAFANNEGESIHPGNDILVGPAVFADVESGTFVSPSSRQFESGGDIIIAVRLGADGWFSAGFVVTGGCDLPEEESSTTTTTTPETSSTTSTSTTTVTVPPVTTTTTPPPINGIDTGGGACADGTCDSRNGFLNAVTIIGLSVAVVALTVTAIVAVWRITDD